MERLVEISTVFLVLQEKDEEHFTGNEYNLINLLCSECTAK
jgi:hypothetical protein